MSRFTSLLVGGVLIGLLLATLGFALHLRMQRARTDGGHSLVLKLGHGLDTTHPVHVAMVFMKERLELHSGGTMTIDLYPGGVLGDETASIEQLQNGSMAMTKTSASVIENFIPAMSVLSLPYLFRDADHCWKVLDGAIGQRLLQEGDAKFLHGLCYYDAGSRNFYTKNKPVRTPDDLKGMKIRVINSKTAMDMVEAMGGSPTPISWGELYSALAQGTVDGAENNLPSFTSSRHYEVCKHFSLDGHSRVPDLLLISTKVWSTLSPQQQGWLRQAASESSSRQRQLWQEKEVVCLEKAKAEGVTIYTVDPAAFAAKVAPMLSRLENPAVLELVKQIAEVK